MNAPKCNEYDYIDFLIATPKVYSCTEAARVQPDHDDAPSHDAINRLLLRIDTDIEDLWQEARPQIDLKTGVLVLDDSTLDKQYAKKIERQLTNDEASGLARHRINIKTRIMH